jgi:predicted amino acid dehydrogenase
MADFTITADVSGALKDLDRYGEDARGAVYAGILRTGYEALAVARTEAPKGATSELVRSITIETP